MRPRYSVKRPTYSVKRPAHSHNCDVFHLSSVSTVHTATHCDALRHTATHCNTLQHTATHCNTLQHTATHNYAKKHIRMIVMHSAFRKRPMFIQTKACVCEKRPMYSLQRPACSHGCDASHHISKETYV